MKKAGGMSVDPFDEFTRDAAIQVNIVMKLWWGKLIYGIKIPEKGYF